MSEGTMRPDGPTANLVRGKIVEIGLVDWRAQTIMMGLAHELDRLRELLAEEIQGLRDRIDDHTEPDDGRHNWGKP